MAPLKLFLLAAPLSVSIGALSWFLVERHFLARESVLKQLVSFVRNAATNLAPSWRVGENLPGAELRTSADLTTGHEIPSEAAPQSAE